MVERQPVMDKLFARQLAKATEPNGEVDLKILGDARRRRLCAGRARPAPHRPLDPADGRGARGSLGKENRTCRAPRSVDRPAQPGGIRRASGAGDRAGGGAQDPICHRLHRSRSLQGGQRGFRARGLPTGCCEARKPAEDGGAGRPSWRVSAATISTSSSPRQTAGGTRATRQAHQDWSRTTSISMAIVFASVSASASRSIRPTARRGDLMVNADAALSRAKRTGAARCAFSRRKWTSNCASARAAARTRIGDRAQRTQTVLSAAGRMDGESHRIRGAAALATSDARQGRARTFIPLAEETGMIMPIGEWVLREACREAASWPQPLTVAVNLSPVQFHCGDLPALVLSILLETGLSPHRLELEITEGVLMNDFARAIVHPAATESARRQHRDGRFRNRLFVAAYLQAFPFDKIKIDKSFIDQLDAQHAVAGHHPRRHRPRPRPGAAGAGRGCGDPEHMEFLKRERCDEIQGYLIGGRNRRRSIRPPSDGRPRYRASWEWRADPALACSRRMD